MVGAFPKQKKVCTEEEVPHRVSLRCAAHHQPPALHAGMHTCFVSVRMEESSGQICECLYLTNEIKTEQMCEV